jgi:hypothetical protein
MVKIFIDQGFHERPEEFHAFVHLLTVLDNETERGLAEKVGNEFVHGCLEILIVKSINYKIIGKMLSKIAGKVNFKSPGIVKAFSETTRMEFDPTPRPENEPPRLGWERKKFMGRGPKQPGVSIAGEIKDPAGFQQESEAFFLGSIGA